MGFKGFFHIFDNDLTRFKPEKSQKKIKKQKKCQKAEKISKRLKKAQRVSNAL